ncbi:DUF4304 domain-containing protein [Sorangium sp. So ce513]|uniref:DUF4304 domain-containing protein n=1 Tax=Sorangium sp. So ce513 TaxID=3133315 RepID=UPI003F62EEC2
MTKNRIGKIVHEALFGALAPYGFKRRGDDYVRRIGEVSHVVNAQRSRWSEGGRVSFTLSCGVHVAHVTSIFRNLPEPALPKMTDCCISARVGMLTASRLDIWWELGDSDDADECAKVQRDVAVTTAESVILFLGRFETELQVAEFLSSTRTRSDELVDPRAHALRMAYAAVVWRKLGDVDRCSACIEEAERQSKRTPLQDVIVAFASRLRADSRSGTLDA